MKNIDLDNESKNIPDNELEDIDKGQLYNLENLNYPGFKLDPDDEAMKSGTLDGSAILGFVGSLNALGLSEKNIVDLIKLKMALNYQLEIAKLQVEASKYLSDTEKTKATL